MKRGISLLFLFVPIIVPLFSHAQSTNQLYNTFTQDTLRIGKAYTKRINNDYSTIGMQEATYETAKAYESLNLVETISKDEYSGGGTLQRLTEASYYLNLIKIRTIDLFRHYSRSKGDE